MRIILLGLLLTLSACDSGGLSASDEAAALSGNWISSQSAQFGQNPDLDLDLRFGTDGTVSGTGTLAKTPGRIGAPITDYLQIRVAGTWTDDSISLDVERVLNSSLFYVLAVDRSTCPSSGSSPVGVLCRASMTGEGQFANPDFSFFQTVD